VITYNTVIGQPMHISTGFITITWQKRTSRWTKLLDM